MRKIIVPAIGGLALALCLTSPAAIADESTWKNGFPPASDIGPSLGAYTTAPLVDISKSKSRWYVCANLRAKPSNALAMAQYSQTPASPGGLRADARVYSSPAAAKAAFTAIASSINDCSGTRLAESEPGSSRTWRVLTTAGTAPALTVAGTESLFVYERQTPAKGSTAKQADLGTNYSVLSLSGDSILVSTADVAGASRFSKTQKDAVVSFARDFAASWAAAND